MFRLLVTLLCFGSPVAAFGQQLLYVSVSGNDSANGCCTQATAQGGPLRTIGRAQELVRQARAKGAWPAGGFVITLLPGRYELNDAIKLDGRDSGNAGAPVIYRGSTVDGVRATRLVGSVRLGEAARSSYGANFVRLTPEQGLSAASEVTLGKQALFEARWPNREYSTITGYSGGTVSLSGEMPALAPGAAVSLAGFLHEDWLFESLAAKGPSSGARSAVQLASGSVRVGARAFVTGSAALLDAADEYLVEAGSNSVLVASSVAGSPELEVSVTPTLVAANGVENVRIEGFVLCNATGTGLELENVENVVVSNVEICNTRGWGARITGRASGLRDSYVHGTGEGGVYLYGGNRQDLTRGEMFVETSVLENVGRLVRTYSPAVASEGVGGTIKGNIIKGSPHLGIKFSGNDHLIAFNDISDVVREAGDMGAIYSGRDWTSRGNVIRANLVYDVLAPGRGAGRGVYLDDQFSSALVESNIFSNVKYGVFIGGGRHNTVRRNVFFSSDPSIFFDARGLDDARMISGNKPTLEKGLQAVPYESAIWTSRYPELARIRGDKPMAPVGNRIHENVFVDGKPIELYGSSAAIYMTEAVGVRVGIHGQLAGRRSGIPKREWLSTLSGQARQVDGFFPWEEFEQLRARALQSR